MSVAGIQVGLFERPALIRDAAPVLASVPSLGVMTPRDYQIAAIDAIKAEFATRRSTLAVLATGLGKTVIASALARENGGVLFIAHRDSLIKQAAQKLRHVTGQWVAVEKAEQRSAGARFVVASVQSLKGDRLKFFAKNHPHINLIIVDEAHRVPGNKSYLNVLAAFPDAKVLLITATADRGDKRAMGLVAESVAYRYDIVDAVPDGWLTPGDWYPLDIEGVSLDAVGVKGGDIDQDALDEEVSKQAAQIARGMHEACKGEMSLGFTPGVKTAIVASEALNRIVPGCARATFGEQDPMERQLIEQEWVRGEFPYLLNCALYIEGADFPALKNVVMFSKTKSRARWAQVYGRGTRLWPHGIDHLATPAERLAAIAASPKPRFKFFDANYGTHGHTLAGPVDLLGGRYDDEVKARAKKKLEDKGGGDVGEALELAAHEIEAEKAAKLAKLAAKAARAKGKVLVGAARDASELFGVAQDMGIEDEPHGAPFEAVVAWLVERGVKNAATMGEGAARGLKRTLQERKAAGLGSYKQVRALRKAGVEQAKALTAGQCGRLMDVLIPQYERGNWNYQFTPAQVQALIGREPGEGG
jgi:superfamily II DNA or RNA helicase